MSEPKAIFFVKHKFASYLINILKKLTYFHPASYLYFQELNPKPELTRPVTGPAANPDKYGTGTYLKFKVYFLTNLKMIARRRR